VVTIDAVPLKKVSNPETKHSIAARVGFGRFLFPPSKLEELQQHKVNFRLDLNLDPRSTNHAHADFWLCEVESHAGQLFQGPKYSINVLDGRDVWLYKPGAPGRVLGTIDDCGEGLREALRDAAEEGGRLFRH
jgi:hypothetical protein